MQDVSIVLLLYVVAAVLGLVNLFRFFKARTKQNSPEAAYCLRSFWGFFWISWGFLAAWSNRSFGANGLVILVGIIVLASAQKAKNKVLANNTKLGVLKSQSPSPGDVVASIEDKAKSLTECTNCNRPILADTFFCSQCGQKHNVILDGSKSEMV